MEIWPNLIPYRFFQYVEPEIRDIGVLQQDNLSS